MTDITTIPMEELLSDRQDSIEDIGYCESALLFGITEYSGGSVQDRLDTNKQIIAKIDAEIARRKNPHVAELED